MSCKESKRDKVYTRKQNLVDYCTIQLENYFEGCVPLVPPRPRGCCCLTGDYATVGPAARLLRHLPRRYWPLTRLCNYY